MRVAPSVITGLRVRNQTSRPAEIPAGLFARISAFMADRGQAKEKRAKTPYEVVFESRYSRHRIQIDSPENQVDARGRKIVERPLVAQFSAGVFSIPQWVKPDKAEYMLEILRKHPSVKRREVWEQSDLNQSILVSKVASIVDLMKKDPEAHKTVLEFLETEDYTSEVSAGAAVEAAADEIEEEPEAAVVAELTSKKRRGRPRKIR